MQVCQSQTGVRPRATIIFRKSFSVQVPMLENHKRSSCFSCLHARAIFFLKKWRAISMDELYMKWIKASADCHLWCSQNNNVRKIACNHDFPQKNKKSEMQSWSKKKLNQQRNFLFLASTILCNMLDHTNHRRRFAKRPWPPQKRLMFGQVINRFRLSGDCN